MDSNTSNLKPHDEDDDKKNADVDVAYAAEPIYHESDHPEYHAKLSWRRKLLYHLWDNDQDLKTPRRTKVVA